MGPKVGAGRLSAQSHGQAPQFDWDGGACRGLAGLIGHRPDGAILCGRARRREGQGRGSGVMMAHLPGDSATPSPRHLFGRFG